MRLFPRSRRGTWLLTGAVWLAACGGWWWVLPVVPRAVWRLDKSWHSSPKVSADGRFVHASLAVDNNIGVFCHQILFWDIDSNRFTNPLKEFDVTAFAVSGDARWIAFEARADQRRRLYLYDRNGGELTALSESKPYEGESQAKLSFLSNDRYLVARGHEYKEGKLDVLRLPELSRLNLPTEWSDVVGASPGGRLLLLVRPFSHYFQFLIWNLSTAESRMIDSKSESGFHLISDQGHLLRVAPFGGNTDATIATAGYIGDVHSYDPDGNQVWELNQVQAWQPVQRNSLLPIHDPKSQPDRPCMEFRDTHDGRVVRGIPLDDRESPRSISPNGQFLAVSRTLDRNSGMVRQWLRQLGFGRSRHFHEKELAVFNVKTGALVLEPELYSHDAVAQFSADDASLIVADQHVATVFVWDIPPRKSLTWIAAGAAILALPIALLARRRVRKLRAA